MLGLRGTLSLGANRKGFAGGGGLAVASLTAAALLLAACQPPQGQLRLAGATDTPAPTTPPKRAEAAAPKPTPLAATPAVAHGETIVPVARLSGDPKELLGLDHSAVRRVLGDPARVRNEMTAQVWQYVTGDCVVDLYLYAEDDGLKVTYVEARSHTAETAPTGRCLKSLLERPTASAN
jgi:hypothetical protein